MNVLAVHGLAVKQTKTRKGTEEDVRSQQSRGQRIELVALFLATLFTFPATLCTPTPDSSVPAASSPVPRRLDDTYRSTHHVPLLSPALHPRSPASPLYSLFVSTPDAHHPRLAVSAVPTIPLCTTLMLLHRPCVQPRPRQQKKR